MVCKTISSTNITSPVIQGLKMTASTTTMMKAQQQEDLPTTATATASSSSSNKMKKKMITKQKQPSRRGVSFNDRVSVRIISYSEERSQEEIEKEKDARWYSNEELSKIKKNYCRLVVSLDKCVAAAVLASSYAARGEDQEEDEHQAAATKRSCSLLLEQLEHARVVYALQSVDSRKKRKERVRQCVFSVLCEQERQWIEEEDEKCCCDHDDDHDSSSSSRTSAGVLQDSSMEEAIAFLSQVTSSPALQEAQARANIVAAHAVLQVVVQEDGRINKKNEEEAAAAAADDIEDLLENEQGVLFRELIQGETRKKRNSSCWREQLLGARRARNLSFHNRKNNKTPSSSSIISINKQLPPPATQEPIRFAEDTIATSSRRGRKEHTLLRSPSPMPRRRRGRK